ncbi:hypothetical protein [Candidatus Uabimicrobium sp. HlEnr_7]|uniref:hypothetical protein n=1 Tax=Candidatus Uabimicrobium helgolandensis TaxID=3095367 RepID=UPI0035591BDC
MKKQVIWILLFFIVWTQCFGFSINFCQCHDIHLGDYLCCSPEQHNNTDNDSHEPSHGEKTSQFAPYQCLDIELENFQFLCTSKPKSALFFHNFLSIIFYQFTTIYNYQTPPNTSNIPPLLQSTTLLI